jgi:hypothetical protein
VGDREPVQNLTIQALNRQRPVIRIQGTREWHLSGQSGAVLTLEGLLLSGCDLVLRGDFDTVRLRCCTLDPGNEGEPPDVFAEAVDGSDLVPSRIWVEDGVVRRLEVERCITGPIRTRGDGSIEQLTISDSIVQAIRTGIPNCPFDESDIKEAPRLAKRLREQRDELSTHIYNRLPNWAQQQLEDLADGEPSALRPVVANVLNELLTDQDLYQEKPFALTRIARMGQQPHSEEQTSGALLGYNRRLLEQAYPLELADSAISMHEGELRLERCTLLGPANLHRLEASECILDDMVRVEDAQHGCVRFSAWSSGSVLPRQYQSVEIVAGSPIFATREFGQPGYSQLLASADAAIVSGPGGATISEGAENGSEMGAFARELRPIKERSLLAKYEEYMPVGLVPVIVYVT